MLPIAQIEMTKQLQDRSLLFWTLLLPIGFIFLFIEVFSIGGNDRTSVIAQTVTGMSVFFSAYVIISIVITFVKDREKGFVARLASTPLPKYQFFLGKSFPFLIIVFFQMLILSALGVWVYGMDISQPLNYFLILLFLSVLVTIWGTAIALFSKTENTGMLIAQIIAMGTGLISGLWIEFDILPPFLQIIGKIFPQYWAHQGLISSVSGISGGESMWIILLVISFYIVVGFILSLMGFKSYLRMARN